MAVLVLLIGAALVYTLLQSGTEGNAADKVRIGQPAPDFALARLEGVSELKLSDYRGKGVLLLFWATWCEPCEREMPLMNEAYQAGVQGVEVIAVNVGESRGSVAQFAVKHDLSFPIGLDPSGEAVDRFGVLGLPAAFLIDAEGRLVKRLDGELTRTDDIVRLLRQVQPSS